MASIALGTPACRAPRAGMLRGDWPALVALAALLLVVRGVWFGNPVADYDEQLYSFIGWRMLHGELPFVDWWDRKPFGLFAIYAAAHALLGPGPIAYQAAATLATFAGAVLTFVLARPLAERAGAAVAAAFYIMLMSAYGAYSGQSEAFHVPLMLGAALLVCDWRRNDATGRALAAMVLCGLALQVKYTVLPQCAFLGLWALVGQWRYGADARTLAALAATFAALGLAPTAVVALFYFLIDEWEVFFHANFLSFFAKAAAPTGRLGPDGGLVLLPVALMLMGGLYSAWRVAPPRDGARYVFAACWFLAALASAVLPRTVYPYYYAALVPPAALLATPLFDRRSIAGFLPALLLLAFVHFLLFLPERAQRSAYERQATARLAALIAPHVSARDCLYVFDGPTVLYRLTGGCVPSRFVYPDHLTNGLEEHAIGISQTGEVARILASGPAAIVTTDRPAVGQNPRSFALAHDRLARDYVEIGKVRLRFRGYHAWVRRDAVQGTASSGSRTRPIDHR